MSANGELRASELTQVQADLYLSVKTARAWARLKAAAKSKQGRTIAIAQKAGAYRSIATQRAIQKAWDAHSPEAAAEWNLDPDSTVRPANPGYSPHGWGTTVDIVGTVIDRDFRALAAKYGFTFPYPDSDPRHAIHDGRTACGPFPPKQPKRIIYTVRAGDTLLKIGATYRVSLPKLLSLNPNIHDANRILVGQKVRVA